MSSQRLSRKEIKHEIREDAFRQAVGESYGYVLGHRRNLLLGAGIVVLLIVAVVGWRTWATRRETAASDKVARAIKVYQAPVVATGATPDDVDDPSFADEKTRQTRAKRLFEELESDYAGTGGAAVAQVYLGRLRLQEGDKAGARRVWEEFLDDHPDHMLAAAVRRTLLDLDREEGKGEQVVQRLRADLEKDKKPLPEDLMLFELGSTLEELGRRQEAHDAFQRVVDEYPDSAWRSKAMEKLRELGGGPGVPSLTIGQG
jgi:predicted negative regulator of RcsB-dependent stress response